MNALFGGLMFASMAFLAILLIVSLPDSMPTSYDLEHPLWRIIGYIVISYPVFKVAGIFFDRARRWASPSLESVLRYDRRSPVLLIRSFKDDSTDIEDWSSDIRATRSWRLAKALTLEETMNSTLRCYGPLIAISRPEEKLPPVGAAREHLGDADWQERVEQHIKSSRIIVALLGDTDGLTFEYQRVIALGCLDRLILVFPPAEPERLESRWSHFCRAVSLDHEVPAEELAEG